MNIAPKYWLGNAESGDTLATAISQFSLAQASGKMLAAFPSREEAGLPPLYTRQGGVGVVSISGSLVSGHAGFLSLFGDITGYDDIRAAVLQALVDPEAKTIMLHVSSGGGMVDGCEELNTFLQSAKKYKPMSTYAGSVMCSAAYWLGSNGDHITTSQTSVLGSLGVIMVHMDRTKMLEDSGVKPTVIRAGQYKALVNPVESLTPEAKAGLQLRADTIYTVFLSDVAPNRKVTYDVADQQMGQGKEFMGKAAVKVGLADKIGTYEQALTYSKSLDTSASSGNNLRKSTGASAMKVTLNAEQLIALAAGASMESLGFAADATLEDSAVDAVTTAATTSTTAAPAVAVETAVMSAELVGANAQITLLTTQLATAQDALSTKASEIAGFKAQLEATSQMPALVEIVRGATAAMLLPLGGSAEAVSQMSVGDLVTRHAEVTAIFKEKIRVGGIAKAVTAEAVLPASPFQISVAASGPQARKLQSQSRK